MENGSKKMNSDILTWNDNNALEKASKIILNGVRKKRTRIFVGLDAKLLDLSQRFFPLNYQKTWPLIFLPMMARNQMLKKPLPDLPSEP